MKKLVALTLALLMIALSFTACGSKDTASSSNGSGTATGGTFTVGFDKEFPPMGFVADDGSYTGFDLDLAKEVASRLNLEIKYQPIDWDSKDFELDTGTIDCIWNGFTITADRENDYTWTEPYMNNNQIVVVKADSSVSTFADLKDAVVAIQKDSSALDAFNANEELKSQVKSVTQTSDNLAALMELDTGAVNAVVMDECVARYNIEKKNGNYKILDQIVGSEKFGVGFKLGNTELRDKVQNTLNEMAADGTLASISKSWFDKDITIVGKDTSGTASAD